jgi:hypothetical protein
MQSSRLVIRRRPYEEPHNIHLEIAVRSGEFSGAVDIYCHNHELQTMATALKQFPVRVGDEYVYEYGSEVSGTHWYRHFALRAYCVDQLGHCALQFAINLNQTEPDEALVRFSIQAEPAAIHRLGELLEHFSRLEHLELFWSPSASELYEQYQDQNTFSADR